MNIKDLIGLKIIDVSQTVEGDEWMITLEGKVRFLLALSGKDDEEAQEKTWCKSGHNFICDACDDQPVINIDIQDYSGALDD